ncbi:hypothetical protein JK159_05420 [Weissella minor]|uniref:hypothetical protein n=1 Tax=Weissella minor TaxID=1620 RepID=UPI001BB05280|nr:hypothetical protein [Weissella minor]MBS0949806.1 hypothetical protein [Weissella minor]
MADSKNINSKQNDYSGYYGYKDQNSKRQSNRKFENSLELDEKRKKERRLKQYRAYGLTFAKNDLITKKDLQLYIDELQKICDSKSE